MSVGFKDYKAIDIKFIHLWKIKKDKNSQSISPYKKKFIYSHYHF